MHVPQGTADYFSRSGAGGGAYYILDGDLCQMGEMEKALSDAGFKVERSPSGIHPGFPQHAMDEYKRALRFLYDHMIEGWWNQRKPMVEHGICTEEEFGARLDRECAARKGR